MFYIIGFGLLVVVPIVGIITDHMQKQTKLKAQMVKDQLELERMKHENFLLETEKMRLELEKMQIDSPKDKINF